MLNRACVCVLDVHLPLDVILQQVLIHGVEVVAAHVVVVVGHRVGKLLAVGSVFHIVGLVAIVVVKMALKPEGKKKSKLDGQKDSNNSLF